MPEVPKPTQNHLLAALAPKEWGRIAPHLQRIEMPLGKVAAVLPPMRCTKCTR